MNSDRPIRSVDEDLLERASLVAQLRTWVLDAPARDGFVVGLTGPWGSGKTSILQLLERDLEDDATVVWFEPWLFSDADQLVVRFFDEISRQLSGKGKRLKKLGRRLADYGAAVSPAAGVLVGPAGQLLAAPSNLADLKQSSAATQRADLTEKLRAAPHRIVVLIDDIDRLEPREIREVLRLVKLVADLPGVVHVLGYDRPRVEAAVAQLDRDDGRAYLEKIVQATMSVPPIRQEELQQLTLQWLDQARGERPLISWTDHAWSELVPGISQYLHTLRDGRRLANVVPAAMDLCRDEVATTDVLALEAIRVFDPDIHDALGNISGALLSQRSGHPLFGSTKDADAANRRKIQEALALSSNPEAARTILRALFPAAGHLLDGFQSGRDSGWRSAKRVAAAPVFMRYLHLALASDQVPVLLVDEALAALADPAEFKAILDATQDTRLHDLVDRLRGRLGEQSDPDVVGCSLVLLQMVPRLPERRGFLELEPSRTTLWLIESLLESIGDLEDRLRTARQLIDGAPNLSLQAELLARFRQPSDEPSKRPDLDLLPPEEVREREAKLADLVLAATDEQLTNEAHPLWLAQMVHDAHGPQSVLELVARPAVLATILTRVGTELHPRSSGGTSLNLNPLTKLTGDGVFPLLHSLASDGGPLPDDVQTALRNALDDAEADEQDKPSE
jgi:hypothetical protein